MEVVTILFIDASTGKQMKEKEYACRPDAPPMPLLRGDVVSFEGKGDDIVRYNVQGRELQEVQPGGFALIYTVRQLPKAE